MSLTNLWIHFLYRHVRDMVAIMEEGNLPNPHCMACDMFVPWAALNRRHPETSLCLWGSETKKRCLVEEKARSGSVTELWAYNRPLETVSSSKYLEHLSTVNNDDWPNVIENIQKARNIWSCLARILGREGADTWTSGYFYITVIQAIFLFGSEMWVVNPRIMRFVLGGAP